MLRWFPRFQVATACFSCSPPDLNFLEPNFIFMYTHYHHCHRVTANLQLNIILLLLLLCRFQNVSLRCPTPRLHCFLSSHWPSFRFLSFMAFIIPSIQFFFGLPRALFCFLELYVPYKFLNNLGSIFHRLVSFIRERHNEWFGPLP